MAPLTEDKQRAFEIGDLNDLPAKAATVVYAGSAVGLDSGYARPLNAGDLFQGFCILRADNSAGANGDINVRVRKYGAIVLPVVGVTGVGDVGKPVYASDDNTFTLTEAGNTRIGEIIRHESGTRCVVAFKAHGLNIADVTALAALTEVTATGAGVDGTGSNAAAKADVDARLADVQANFAAVEAKITAVINALNAAI